MSKRKKLLLIVCYGVILLVLLAIQMRYMNGTVTRLTANLGALVLVLPCAAVLRLWLKADEAEGDNAKNSSSQPKVETEDEVRSREKSEQTSSSQAAVPQQANTSRAVTPQQEVSHRIQDEKELRECLQSYSLTNREYDVAWLVYCGYRNRQIAEELYISETTVKKHVSHIYEKLEISGRKEFLARLYEA